MADLGRTVALVTGGASGIGKAIAQRLSLDGAHVVISDLQAAVGQTVAARFGFGFLEQDVTDEGRWHEVVREIRERHGALHILVNNAGILNRPTNNTVEDSRLEDWRRTFAVNVEGVFLGCRVAIPAMHASGGGSIVNISSMAGILATPSALAYGASKAAVRHMTKSIAQHCAQKKLNIRCNSVHPGIVRTPPWEEYLEDSARSRGVSVDALAAEIQSAIPMGEFTSPEDIAAGVAFLASPESRCMTGAELVIDGGLVHCDTYHMDLLRRQMSGGRG